MSKEFPLQSPLGWRSIIFANDFLGSIRFLACIKRSLGLATSSQICLTRRTQAHATPFAPQAASSSTLALETLLLPLLTSRLLHSSYSLRSHRSRWIIRAILAPGLHSTTQVVLSAWAYVCPSTFTLHFLNVFYLPSSHCHLLPFSSSPASLLTSQNIANPPSSYRQSAAQSGTASKASGIHPTANEG